MNKTISITLAGLVFNIEENAYPILKEYLDSIKQLFSSQSYGQEVYTDIETRIAEQFKKKLTETKVEVITMADVNHVIKEMGTTADFGAEEKTEKTKSTGDRKLYRNSEDVIIAGVASGIAAYFGWDTILVRIIFGLTVIFGGWGIPLYILLWIVMPEAKTTGQKLEMRGSAVNLKQFEQTVKEKSEQIRNSGFFASLGQGISAVVKFLSIFIRTIVGGVIIFGASIAIFATTITAAIMLFNRNSPNMDPILAQVLVGSEYYIAVILGLAFILIPLLLLTLAGISLFRRKTMMTVTTIIIMTVIWFAAGSGLAAIATRAAPEIEAAVNTTYPVITKNLDFKDFNKISTGSDYEVHITQGKTYSVTLKGAEKDFQDVDIKITNQTLDIGKNNRFIICFFCWNRSMSVDITMPALEGLEASGAAKISAQAFTTNQFSLDLSGASRADLDLTVKEFTSEISGASRLVIKGTTDKTTASLSGASNMEAYEFITKTADVEASGASKAYLNVLENLKVDASGASKINYKGDPELEIEESGSSKIEKF